MHANKTPTSDKPSKAETLSLETPETPETPETEYFYFKVSDLDLSATVIYKFNRKLAVLVPLFKNMCDTSKESNTEETAVHIKPVYIQDDCVKNPEFWINTPELFDVVIEYIDIWKDNPKNANYIKEDCVQTGNADQIIKVKDLALINKFIDKRLVEISADSGIDFDFQPTQKKWHIISCLNPLLKMTDGFLHMSGFANKIYAYISTVIWNCSMKELNDASKDPVFKALQQAHIDEFNRINANTVDFIADSEDVVGLMN
jgi:hypothetical protein